MQINQVELVSCILRHLDYQGVKQFNQRQMNTVIEAANLIVSEVASQEYQTVSSEAA